MSDFTPEFTPAAPADLAAARGALDRAEAAREAVLLRHIANGVAIDSRTVSIDEGVRIAPGARILPGTILRGDTVIGAGCVIGPNALIEDSAIGEGTTVNASQVYASQIGPHNNIGPFTHIRAGTVTDYGVHLGAYVETKNSNFARGNTVSHLTYIGDSDVGKYCNFGCGTVTCNYDGAAKHRTTIGDYCFIGCNTNLVAPVSVGDGAYTAAGSTVTRDVPAAALAIERGQQANVEGWAGPRMAAYIAKKQKLEAEQRAAEQAEPAAGR
ncbi:MAG TPA: UDP-N-acetylglucosamine diphosphorylase [Candidatus Faecalibacterium faecipullorum]|uniref:UDP-N-acetylglucosamine diphosphorylase n=1 Tax=Candidatus Faecalibacterium faecipullorum TaxID=2838578 RepID=A0A9D2MH79_9FIRM|nr:UDP-N-acetylglucosamine diphosphorylase [Candidatus Faecalibacterium faecipullorum]